MVCLSASFCPKTLNLCPGINLTLVFYILCCFCLLPFRCFCIKESDTG